MVGMLEEQGCGTAFHVPAGDLPARAFFIFLPIKGIQKSLNAPVAQNPSVVTVATQIVHFSKNGCCRTEAGPGCSPGGTFQLLSVCV